MPTPGLRTYSQLMSQKNAGSSINSAQASEPTPPPLPENNLYAINGDNLVRINGNNLVLI
jgi:hypothetical protein